MITVTHEKTVMETFRLIETGASFMGHDIFLKAPSIFADGEADRVTKNFNSRLRFSFPWFEGRTP